MNKHYKIQERKRKERDEDTVLKITNGYGVLFGKNTKLQKSQHKRCK